MSRSKQKEVLPELPKAPKVAKGPSEAELRERAELEENQLRRLRMCFRDICNRWRPHPALAVDASNAFPGRFVVYASGEPRRVQSSLSVTTRVRVARTCSESREYLGRGRCRWREIRVGRVAQF